MDDDIDAKYPTSEFRDSLELVGVALQIDITSALRRIYTLNAMNR